MEDYYIFKWCFAAVFVLLVIIRTYSRIRFDRRGPFSLHHLEDGLSLLIVRWILAVPLIFSMIGYVFLMDHFSWMYITLPRFIRGIGVSLGFGSICFLGIVHYYLGINFNSASSVKDNHALVTRGPYALVRHPMYLTFILLFIASFMITENWLMGLSGVLIILSLMTLRLRYEEAKLIEEFGDQYRSYMEITGRFVPKLRRRRTTS